MLSEILSETLSNIKPKENVYVRTKPHINVGTIWHVDHGRATLSPSAMVKIFDELYSSYNGSYNIDDQREEKPRVIYK